MRWIYALVLLFAGGFLIRSAWQAGLTAAAPELEQARHQISLMTRRLQDKESESQEYRQQLAKLRISQPVQAASEVEIRQQMEQDQSLIAAQKKELEFYRSVLSADSGNTETGIGDLKILPLSRHGHYRVSFGVYRTLPSGRHFTGSLQLGMNAVADEGEQHLSELDLGLDEEQLSLDFRYFQRVNLVLILDPGIQPYELYMRVVPSGGKAVGEPKRFPWQFDQAEEPQDNPDHEH